VILGWSWKYIIGRGLRVWGLKFESYRLWGYGVRSIVVWVCSRGLGFRGGVWGLGLEV